MKYRDAASFRQALEQRLNNEFRDQPARIARTRRTIASERLLARLAAVSPDSLLLKGGFALELRLADSARATKDIDLNWLEDKADLLDVLLVAAQHDAGDFFHFRFERDAAAQDRFGGSHRFRVTAEVSGRTFDRFVVDVAFDSTSDDDGDDLVTKDSLGFAGVQPARIKAISLERQVVTTFTMRAAQIVPIELPPPPPSWATPYAGLAGEVGIPTEIELGYALAASLIDPILAGAATHYQWDSQSAMWIGK